MPTDGPAARRADRPLRVVVLSWRDTGHPEGGGAELYLDHVLTGLVGLGRHVTLLTARYPGSARRQRQDGYDVRRAGGRWSVYPLALLQLVLLRRRVDVVVDVQNGMPFLSRLVTRKPVVVLCHHVHREQWSIALGSSLLGRIAARFGWWVESCVAPRLYRGCRYVTVSRCSAGELVALGIRSRDITVVHNGAPAPVRRAPRAPAPELLVLGRLVPHKQVEHALRAVAALRAEHPDLHLTVAGQGWWEPEIRAEVDRLGLDDCVTVAGFVDAARKEQLLARAWVHVTPSVKEGWGLSVIEAAAHGTPSVAYRAAGGVAESIVHGSTGWLAEHEDDLLDRLRSLLADGAARSRMGAAAELHAAHFTWQSTTRAFSLVLDLAAGLRPVVALPRPSVPGDDLVREPQRVSH